MDAVFALVLGTATDVGLRVGRGRRQLLRQLLDFRVFAVDLHLQFDPQLDLLVQRRLQVLNGQRGKERDILQRNSLNKGPVHQLAEQHIYLATNIVSMREY